MNRRTIVPTHDTTASRYLVTVTDCDTTHEVGTTTSYGDAFAIVRSNADALSVHLGAVHLIPCDEGFHAVFTSGTHRLYRIAPANSEA